MDEQHRKPFQFGLASLFGLTLGAAFLLWAWRFGVQRVIVILAVLPAVVMTPIYLVAMAGKILRKMRDSD
jgi:hypothetical protein